MNDVSRAAAPPGPVRVVGWLLIIAGVLYAFVGTISVGDTQRGSALVGTAMLVFGAACIFVGWRLLATDRWAYWAAVALLVAAASLGIVRAITEADRALLSQVFLPILGAWFLLRRETRDYFAS